MKHTTVIIGASLGGTRTAQALRSQGYDGRVVLVGDEPSPPYDRPPLSKGFLAGTDTEHDLTLLTPDQADALEVNLHLGNPATALRLPERVVELADGSRLGFDHLVVATGARPRPSPWGTRPGVHLLRTRDDALALRENLRGGGPLVIIGAGFIGAEVAATARGLGVDPITVVDPVPVPLSRVLNPAVAELFTGLHADRGVHTRFGVGVAGIDPDLTVRLADGSNLPAGAVLVGIGAVPNDQWLRGSGLTVDDGLVCDEYCRAVGAPFVHAVGDVARWRHPRHGRLVRAEHWTNAVDQAACVARAIARPDDPIAYDPVEYVWSDQYDWRVQLIGRTGGELRHELVPGADPARAFAVLYADAGGCFVGAVTVNWPGALSACRRALGTRIATPVALIRDQVLAKVRPRAA